MRDPLSFHKERKGVSRSPERKADREFSCSAPQRVGRNGGDFIKDKAVSLKGGMGENFLFLKEVFPHASPPSCPHSTSNTMDEASGLTVPFAVSARASSL